MDVAVPLAGLQHIPIAVDLVGKPPGPEDEGESRNKT